MNTRLFIRTGVVCAILLSCFLFTRCKSNLPDKQPGMSKADMAARGKYLVLAGGCNDCHSPKVFLPDGTPLPDTTRLLSGHPSGAPLPAIDTAALHPGNWVLGAPDLTAWVGPWGMSFTANLTPDAETGLGNWTEEMFVDAMRKGKHMGLDASRPILPPMPWYYVGQLQDDDLRAIFAYLQSLPPISNKVPDPLSPPEVMKMAMP